MSVQKNIHLSVIPSTVSGQPEFEIFSSLDDCQIDIQVAHGWVVTGYYRENVLQAVNLRKNIPALEAK